MHTDFSIHVQDTLNSHPRNTGIVYDPEPHTYHRYHDNGDVERYYGVTSLLKRYSPFDAKSIKYGIVNSKKPEYAHLNSIEDVEAEWKAARDHGTNIHNDLEESYHTGQQPEYPESQMALEFIRKKGLIPVGSEFVVFCDRLKRATPIDIPLVNKHGQLVVGDWKTSKEIKYDHYEYNGKKKKMEYPLTHLPTANFYSYSLQVGLTIHWLKKYYKLPFPIAPYGYIFHIRDGKFKAHRTLPMQNEIRMIYDWEKRTN